MKRFHLMLALFATIFILAACSQKDRRPAPTFVFSAETTTAAAVTVTADTPAPTYAATAVATVVPAITPAARSNAGPAPEAAPTPDQTPPRITGVAPAHGWVVTDLRPEYIVTFNRPVDKVATSAALTLDPPYAYGILWPDDSTMVVVPLENLTPGTRYTVAFSELAQAPGGVRLTGISSRAFTVASLVATMVTPGRTTTGQPLTFAFNYPMESRLLLEAFSIEPAIAGTASWRPASQSFVFVPSEPWQPATEYVVRFSGPLWGSSVGDALIDPNPISLQTDDLVRRFHAPAAVVNFEPVGSAASPRLPIRIAFDRPVDRRSAENAFSLEPNVSGLTSWEENTLVFTPTSGRLPAESYFQVTLAATVRDERGQPLLSEPLHFYFSTTAYASVADFGIGVPLQVVASTGRRAVHYRGLEYAAIDIRFVLYHIPPASFMERFTGDPLDASGLTPWGSWIETTGTVGSRWLNPQEVLLPQNVPPGAYLLTIEGADVEAGLFVLLTDHALTVKQGGAQLLVWNYSLNGSPIRDAELSIYSESGAWLGSVTSDHEGTAELPAGLIDPYYVVAQHGDEVVLTGIDHAWRHGWWQAGPAAYQIHVATERPIYQPGQRVFFRAIVRDDNDALLSPLPAGTPVQVTIFDPRSNRVRTFDLIANDFGSVDGAFDIASGAPLGDYAVHVTANGSSNSQVFKVQAYRKPDYAVTVTSAADRVAYGGTVSIRIQATYFMGEPVSGATVTIQKFGAAGDGWYRRGRARTLTTDSQGVATYTFVAEFAGQVAIDVTVDDGGHQSVSAQTHLKVYPADQQLDIQRSNYLKTPGAPFAVDVLLVDIFDEALANRPVTIELRRYNRMSRDYDLVIDSATGATDGAGRLRASLTAPDAGYFRLVARATASGGKLVEESSWIFAWSRQTNGWSGTDDALQIYGDKDTYLPGETARIFIATAATGEALLTLERGGIHGQFLVALTPPLTVVEVPIESRHAPNIFVGVQVWLPQENELQADLYRSQSDHRLEVATFELQVPAVDKVLQVSITPDQEQYQPGDTAVVTVRVTNYAGVPVSAELSLAAVDEAIFALSPDLTIPLYDAFYFARENSVRTYDSMRPSRYLWYGGGGGGGGGGDYGESLTPRADFADTAAWFPALRTDANGEVTVTFVLPDNLTSWRLTAQAATADTQVGSATANVLVHQDIVVRPLLPRVLTAGDSWQLSALVHNYSDRRQAMVVSLAVPAGVDLLAVGAPLTQTITLAPGEAGIVGWPATVPLAGSGFLTVAALSPTGMGDAVRLPLTVQPLAVPDVTTLVGQFGSRLDATLSLPADALDMSVIEIKLSRSIAGTLIEGTEYLTGFPYGCVEQTMSRALPNAVVGRAMLQLGLGDPVRFGELAPMIQASIQRLYGFQHNDGGWGWWYSDPSHDYQTAWVVFGLAVTAQAGHEVDPVVIERGAAWLARHLEYMDVRTRAFALYSMARAGHGDLAQTEALLTQMDHLDTFSRAALALALADMGETTAAQPAIDALLATVTIIGDEAYWEGDDSDGHYARKTMASDVRNTALALSALTQVRPETTLAGSVVNWLMNQRQTAGWGTTNETSFALLALTDYWLTQPNTAAPTSVTIWLNDQPVASGALGPGVPSLAVVLPVGADLAGTNNLRITQDGAGDLYYTINRRAYVAQAQLDAAGSIHVDRAYFDPRTNLEATDFKPGELVRVRLTVNLPESASYILVEDHLPGGLEALNETLANSSIEAVPGAHNYTYKEVWADRVSFFISELTGGTHIFDYYARITQAGTFTAMPAEASAMYDLTLWGRSRSDQIVIAP